MKQTIRLTESRLKRMIAESVRQSLNEANYNIGTGAAPDIDEILSALHDLLTDVEWVVQEQSEEEPERAKQMRAAYQHLTMGYNILLGGQQQDKDPWGSYDDESMKKHLSRKTLGHDKYGRYQRFH